MAISPTLIASYAPWGNAELRFTVGSGVLSNAPDSGNYVEAPEVLEYLAALSIQPPDWKSLSGVDSTVYSVRGRLLSPAELDPRITNGVQAEAKINNYYGRLELTFDLAMDAYHRQSIRQSIQGTFRVTGGFGLIPTPTPPPSANPPEPVVIVYDGDFL